MITEEARDYLEEENPEALLCDGLEAAFVGIARRKLSPPLAAYSIRKIMLLYIEQGMSYDEAREYFEFNVVDAWAGDGTPIFIEDEDL